MRSRGNDGDPIAHLRVESFFPIVFDFVQIGLQAGVHAFGFRQKSRLSPDENLARGVDDPLQESAPRPPADSENENGIWRGGGPWFSLASAECLLEPEQESVYQN